MSQSILLMGAGAVGSCVGAWLTPYTPQFYIYDRQENVQKLNQKGISAYLQHHKGQANSVKVNAIADLTQCPVPDVILLCVKNYSLEGLSQQLIAHFGADNLKHTLVVGLQNGVENQNILPQYFSNVVYGIVTFNAWLDGVGVVGYQSKGPFVFGTPDNSNRQSVEQITALFSQGVEASKTEHFQDAAFGKMVVNLTNSFTTLTGFGVRDIDSMSKFQTILSKLIYEGVNIVKAAGFKECQVGNAPPWWLIKASALLPQFLTRSAFKRNVKKMVLSSMAQDVIKNGSNQTELEDINGYLLALAQKHQVDAPYNQAIFKLCQQQFATGQFEPMSVSQVWQILQSH